MPAKHRQKTAERPDNCYLDLENDTASDSTPLRERKKVRWEQNVPVVETSTYEENNSDEEVLAREKERICLYFFDSHTKFIADLSSRMLQAVSESISFNASLA